MKYTQKIGVVVGLMAMATGACSVESKGQEKAVAPEVSLDSLDEQTEGLSYNGWSQWLEGEGYACFPGVNDFISHQLSRSFGDSTRGGGACLVYGPGASCSSDSTCISSAQASYGSNAWGYCYQSKCYARRGSQATYCTVNPNRTAGTLYKWFEGGNELQYNTYDKALGCMTKTAGPNYACGGTDTSLYMRYVRALDINYACY